MSKKFPWYGETFIALDLETTGQYPLQAEICEIAAIKWRDGKVIDEFQTLIRPSVKMDDFVIGIHNISNEMVSKAPKIDEKIKDIYHFIQDGYVVAHHAPFDLGFLTVEFEKRKMKLPKCPAFCSSIFARRAFPESPNHKLQTLIKYLDLNGGQAHRALDDARACLQLILKCFERVGKELDITGLLKYQKTSLLWDHYSLLSFKKNSHLTILVDAIKDKKNVLLVYHGGSKPGKEREVKPIGLVRSPTGDFLVAKESEVDEHPKRYYLNRVGRVDVV